MKRLFLAAALVAGCVAATAAPAQAAPICGPIVGVNCSNGGRFCRVWIAANSTCI